MINIYSSQFYSFKTGYLGTFFSRFGEPPFDRRYLWCDKPWKIFGEAHINDSPYYNFPNRPLRNNDNENLTHTPRPGVLLEETANVYTLTEDFTGKNVSDKKAYNIGNNVFPFENTQNSIQYQLQEKNVQFILKESEVLGRGSYNVGENHLVWTDGEPIDPFHVGIVAKSGNEEFKPLLSRSVIDSGIFTDFSPQQRAVAGRDPIFEQLAENGVCNVPEWATKNHPTWQQMRDESLVRRRLPFLRDLIKQQLSDESNNPDDAYLIPSLTERARVVATRGYEGKSTFPDRGGNTLHRWKNGYCFYSHFVSAKNIEGDLNFVDPSLELASKERWIIRYALGSCDGDAGGLVHFYGELYIPVQ